MLPHTLDAVVGLLSQAFSFETVVDVVFAEEFCFALEDFVFEDLDETPLLETTTAVVVPQSSSSYKSISPDTSTDFSDLPIAELVVPAVFSALPTDVVELEVTPPDELQALLSHKLPPPRRRARPAFSALADDDASLPAELVTLSHLLVVVELFTPPPLDHPSSSQSPSLLMPLLPRMVVVVEEA
mgnify:CR=1 FL=1